MKSQYKSNRKHINKINLGEKMLSIVADKAFNEIYKYL